MSESKVNSAAPWQSSACILCECNCGIEIKLGGDKLRNFVKVRGDKAHPSSRGYACEKPSRLDYYQNGRDRLASPMRRRDDGSYESISWDTAIREVADRLATVRDTHGGESIFYFGGASNATHLPSFHATATLSVLENVYRSNAIAQEKTGEFWVAGEMFGASLTRADLENCEVALFMGKNPWMSHSHHRARVVLREIAKDPDRALIVVDPRNTASTELADVHLRVKPGRDAWLMSAIIGTIVQEKLCDFAWIAERTVGIEVVRPVLEEINVSDACEIAGVSERLVRETARRIAGARSVAIFEDLGVQMNRNSTLISYLNKLLWALTGNFAKEGTAFIPSAIYEFMAQRPRSVRGPDPTTPVSGSKVISGMVPCNALPDEILSDHPGRTRALIVEATNPAHSIADSQRMREAIRSLEFSVVIDVAMTETARVADYVLPAASTYEKPEATTFNFEFPRNYFHLRHPILEPLPGTLPEIEIHARLVEALGAMPEAEVLDRLRVAARESLRVFRQAFFAEAAANPKIVSLASVVLYRTLGEALPAGMAAAATIWILAQGCVAAIGASVRRAGIGGDDPDELGNDLFQAILDAPSGLVFSVDEFDESWNRVNTPDGKIHLEIPELIQDIIRLQQEGPPAVDPDFPLVLSAGERRSFTGNTLIRDPDWRKKDRQGALKLNPKDAQGIGLATGDRARLITKRGTALAVVEVTDEMHEGHISIPNGAGISYPSKDGLIATGIAPNELTASEDRDPYAGTPWHKHTPARVERVS